ncbi:MAG: AsmA-like C-terminal domain-containing protein [Deltaproteobacteria bacterium]|nr:AsmA-like C-terminal domain-containing protein [Deltaproteobacteria bacterium]
MSRTIKRIIIYAGLAGLILAVSATYLADRVINRPENLARLNRTLESYLGHQVSFSRLETSLWGGVLLKAHKVSLSDPATGFNCIAKSVAIGLDILALLNFETKPESMVLDSPSIEVTTNSGPGQKETDSGAIPFPGPCLDGLHRVIIKHGRVNWRIQGPASAAGDLSFSDVYLDAGLTNQDKCSFHLSCLAGASPASGQLRLSGKLVRLPGPSPNKDHWTAQLSIDLAGWDVMPFKPIFPGIDHLFEQVGPVSASLKYTVTKESQHHIQGMIKSGQTTLNLNGYRPTLSKLVVRGEATLADGAVKVSGLKLASSELNLSGDLLVGAVTDPRARVIGHFRLNPMPYDEALRLTPTGLFKEWISRDILFRLNSGRVSINQADFDVPRKSAGDGQAWGRGLRINVLFDGIEAHPGEGIPPFTRLSGQAGLANGHMVFKRVTAVQGKNRVQDFELSLENVFFNCRPGFSTRCDFDLKDIKTLATASMVPRGLQAWMDGFKSLSGAIAGRLTFKQTPTAPIAAGRFRLNQVSFTRDDFPLPVRDLTGLVSPENKDMVFDQISGRLGDSQLSVNGRIQNFFSPNRDYQVTVQGRARLGELLKAWPGVAPDWLLASGDQEVSYVHHGPLSGFGFKGQTSLKGLTLTDPGWSLALPGETGALLLEGTWDGQSGLLEVERAELTSKKSLGSANGKIGCGSDGQVDLSLTSSGLDLADLDLYAGTQHLPVTGRIAGHISLTGPRSNLTVKSGRGNFTLDQISLPAIYTPEAVMLSGKVSLDAKGAHLKDWRGQVGQSDLAISGTLDRLNKPRGQLEITGETLRKDDFIASGTSPAELSRFWNFLNDTNISSQIKFHRVLYGQAGYKAVSGRLGLNEGQVVWAPFSMEVSRTKLAGEMKILLPPRRGFQAEVDVKATEDKIEEIVSALGFPDKTLSGKISLNGHLTGQSYDSVPFVNALAGNLTVEADTVSMKSFKTLILILNYLNESQALPRDFPDPAKEGLRFTQMKCNLSIKDGIARSEDFFLDSPDIRCLAEGNIRLKDQELDLSVGVLPLRMMDKVVSHIPIAGYILTGENKNLVAFYFKVTGRPGQTKVEPVSISPMGGGLLNMLKRLVTTPFRLLSLDQPDKKSPPEKNP